MRIMAVVANAKDVAQERASWIVHLTDTTAHLI